jgi:hypothetical protein
VTLNFVLFAPSQEIAVASGCVLLYVCKVSRARPRIGIKLTATWSPWLLLDDWLESALSRITRGGARGAAFCHDRRTTRERKSKIVGETYVTRA